MDPSVPRDVAPKEPERDRRRVLWLFLGIGLAGILAVALIVNADRSFAGIDGLRGVHALVPDAEADPPGGPPSLPVIGGLIGAIHDLAPVLFAPPPSTAPVAAAPSGSSSHPATSPAVPGAPAAHQPASPTPSAAPSATSSPTPSPSQTVAPGSTFPTPAPTGMPAPTVAITTDRGATAIVNLNDLVPGDSVTRTVMVGNSGSLGFRYSVSAAQSASTALWTDTTNGLQLTVRTAGGAVLYTGPLSALGALAGPSVLAPGATETLQYAFDFPASAPNVFQGLSQDLDFVFVAVQFP